MNITDTNVEFNISHSDNSHIFGRPIMISEGADGFMDIPILDKEGHRRFEGLDEWVKKISFLEKAGIEMHLKYVNH